MNPEQTTNESARAKRFKPGASRVAVGMAGLNSTKLALLISFMKILVKGNVHYCEPFPDTSIELLERFHKISIGRRWFFQCMHDLEAAGFMRRKRRWKIEDSNLIRSNSSLWWFTIRGARYLVSKSIRGADQLLKSMLTWLHRGDDRLPTFRDIAGADDITDQQTALHKIRDLIDSIGRGPAGANYPAPD